MIDAGREVSHTPSAVIVGSEPAVVIPAARTLARYGFRCIVAVTPGGDFRLDSRAIADVVHLHGSTVDAAALLEMVVESEGAALVVPTSDASRALVASLRTQASMPVPADVEAATRAGGTGVVPWSWHDPLPTIQQHWLRTVGRLVPARTLATARTARSLPSSRRWRYAARRAARVVRSGREIVLPPTVRSVLFVCHGNRMRSVVAEHLLRAALFQTALSGLEIISAGTHARAGLPADDRVRGAALSLGTSLDGHESRPLDEDLVDRADIILVMDDVNATDVEAAFPDAAAKLHLLGDIAPEADGESPEIPDPFFASDEVVVATVRRINDAVTHLAHLLLARDAQAESTGDSRG